MIAANNSGVMLLNKPTVINSVNNKLFILSKWEIKLLLIESLSS